MLLQKKKKSCEKAFMLTVSFSVFFFKYILWIWANNSGFNHLFIYFRTKQ